MPYRFALCCLITICSPTQLTASEAILELQRQRDDLLQQLTERFDEQRADACDWHISGPELFEGERLAMQLHRRGGAWVATELDGGPDGIWIEGIDTSDLQVGDNDLQGQLAIDWRQATVEGIGGRHWESHDTIRLPEQQTTRIAIDVDWTDQRRRFHFRLSDGVMGHPVLIDVIRDGDRIIDAYCTTPAWNRGVHELDIDQLNITDTGVSGRVETVLHPDKWVPKDQQPRRQSYELDGQWQGNQLAGHYTGDGDLGALKGELGGHQGRIVTGTATSTGPFGTVYAELRGRITTPALITPEPEASEDPTLLYRQIAALQELLRNPLADWQQALSEARCLQPTASVDAWLPMLADFTTTTVEGDVLRGNHAVGDPAFGPYYDIVSWDATGLQPVDEQTWLAPPEWQLVGPLPDPHPQQTASLPEVLAIAGTAYGEQSCRNVPTIAIAGDAYEVHTSIGQYPHELYFASTRTRCAEAQRVWCAIRCTDQGQLWCNGRLVWTSRDGVHPYDGSRYAIFPVELQAGDNRFDLRLSRWFEGAQVELYLQPLGAPSPASADPAQQTTTTGVPTRGFRGDGSARFPDATPPIAWDIAKDRNLAWHRQLAAGSGDPVVWEDQVLVTAAPNQLLALQLSDGAERWSVAVGPAYSGEGLVTTSPLVDSERIYALAHHGHLTACDRSGAVLWQVATGLDQGRGIGLPAPVRIADLVVIMGYVVDPDAENGKKHRRVDCIVVAYEAATGTERWRQMLPTDPRIVHTINGKGDSQSYRDGLAYQYNGLSPLSLERGSHRRDLLICSNGLLLDASDGRPIERRARAISMHRCAPYILGTDSYFFTPQGQSGLRCWLTEDGTLGVRERWRDRRRFYLYPPEDTFNYRNTWHKGPVERDGLFFVQRQTWNHWPRHHPKPYCEVSSYTPDDGRRQGRQRKALWKATNPAANPASIGDHLFFTDSGDGKYDGIAEHGQVAVALPGERPLIINDNDCGKLYSTPIAAGNRLLLRTMDGLACLARDAEGGTAFEQERLAYYIVDRLPAFPKTPPAKHIAPAEGDYFGVDGIPVARMQMGVMSDRWLSLGPLPPKTALPDPGALRPRAGDSVDAHGAFDHLAREHLQVGYNVIVYWSDRPPKTYRINLGSFSNKKPSSNYFYTVWNNSRARTVKIKYSCTGPVKLGAHLAGTPVADGDIVRLEAGFYPLLLTAEVGRIPPFMRGKGVILELELEEAPDRQADLADWVDQVEPYESILKEINRVLPDSMDAGKARHILVQLDRARE